MSDVIKGFIFQGMEDLHKVGSNQYLGECPFCLKEKFYVNEESSEWDCKSCVRKGNLTSFLQQLWEESFKKTKGSDWEKLTAERKLLFPETCSSWEMARSIITGEWLIPGYSPGGKLIQLYRWVALKGKKALLATTGIGHQLFGVHLYNPKLKDVWLCEGPWDAMSLWELSSRMKKPLGNILAVPGCGATGEGLKQFAQYFSRKNVYLLFDNDYPTPNNDVPAGLAGCRRAVKHIGGITKSVKFLCWEGVLKEGYSKDYPAGYDVRDYLSLGKSYATRLDKLPGLIDLLQPVPDEWLEQSKIDDSKPSLELLPCSDWGTLVNAWRKALKWVPGLDKALSVMLAAAVSTETVGDQLWIKIMGPAASAKSTLCEALAVAKEYIFSVSSMRGFHSGWREDGNKDSSLIDLLRNKTLVIKDGDTLLQQPNLPQILAEGRDLYDRVSRAHYRNRVNRSYEGINITWLLCGTSSLRSIDSSELGERFLDCVILDEISDDLEDEIAWRVVNRAVRESTIHANGQVETREGPELVEAKRLTGGYVSWLRKNAIELIKGVEVSDSVKRQCLQLAKFVAYMRARPSARQREKVEREMSFRLTSQLARLSQFLAVVLNRKEVDQEVMSRVRAVALDTARGLTLNIIKLLRQEEEGLGTTALAIMLGQPEERQRGLLLFLRGIRAVESITSGHKKLWKLADNMRKLCDKVYQEESHA